MYLKLFIGVLLLLFSILSQSVVLSFEQQDVSWNSLTPVLQKHVDNHAFPGCVALVANKNGILYLNALGHFTYGKPAPKSNGKNPPMTVDTHFDMASVTKVLATTSAIAQFYQRGELDLDTKISDEYLLGPNFAARGKGDISVRNCLLHNAGFPPDPNPNYWDKSFGCPATSYYHPPQVFNCYDQIYHTFLDQNLINPVGQKYLYSDLSMITLMYVVGHLAHKLGYVTSKDTIPGCPVSLGGDIGAPCYYEAYVRQYVLGRLQMKDSGFRPSESLWHVSAPAWNDTVYRHEVIQGTVSDGNSYALGGISGHAGLFSTVLDVHKLLFRMMFPEEKPGLFLNSTTVSTFTTVYNTSQSSRALGWDTNHYKMNHIRSCGSLSSKTYLHLGYTGTQVCNDPDRELITVLLTNRVYPDTSNRKIAKARQDFNNAVRKIYDAIFK